MWNWLHHLFNPHCQECLIEKESSCKSCEILKQELALSHAREQKYIDALLVQEDKELVPQELPKPIISAYKPWRVKQAELENEEKKRAVDLMNRRTKEIEKLEEELGVENG